MNCLKKKKSSQYVKPKICDHRVCQSFMYVYSWEFFYIELLALFFLLSNMSLKLPMYHGDTYCKMNKKLLIIKTSHTAIFDALGNCKFSQILKTMKTQIYVSCNKGVFTRVICNVLKDRSICMYFIG